MRDLDRQGTRLVDALAENGVALDRMLDARAELKRSTPGRYLELHIEQGPVLESTRKSTGVVLGTFGVERHMIQFTGQAAHSGSTPIAMRRDAFLAAAQTALECREIALRHSKPAPGEGVVCTVGIVNVEPKIVTAVPGVCEISLDQRALERGRPARRCCATRKAAARRAAVANRRVREWRHVWRIDSRPFDPALIACAKRRYGRRPATRRGCRPGRSHDAAEMVPHMPVVMMFAYSSNGLSHCKEEDTPIAHLETTIRAYLRLVQKTIAHVSQS